jgi:hypothetical protein
MDLRPGGTIDRVWVFQYHATAMNFPVYRDMTYRDMTVFYIYFVDGRHRRAQMTGYTRIDLDLTDLPMVMG